MSKGHKLTASGVLDLVLVAHHPQSGRPDGVMQIQQLNGQEMA